MYEERAAVGLRADGLPRAELCAVARHIVDHDLHAHRLGERLLDELAYARPPLTKRLDDPDGVGGERATVEQEATRGGGPQLQCCSAASVQTGGLNHCHGGSFSGTEAVVRLSGMRSHLGFYLF